ncbi:hypothetical protein F3K02_04080 [Hydrogenophaga sp. D2P1]|uniref:Uncharacterized protein n=1 Tax=Hydrogenophaga aromaticivorans TaxID=2610898 RepID=A0A7Y8GUL6_9BURK|nr:hypothetical protein [Hydrogenophaga aromaticivorans]NWF44433.1 hypothetical protein [Hydrogenophaga aromaticivorans]
MNLKSILGLKTTPALSTEAQAIADRVSTAEGCQALADELNRQREALPVPSAGASLLRRKLDELSRVMKGHAIATDRPRAAAVLKRDMDSASKSIKAAEARLKSASEAASLASGALAERVALVNRLNLELVELHAAADKAVEIARSGFKDALAADDATDADEAAAFDTVKEAEHHRATCGESLASRIKGHDNECQRLEQASAEASAAARQAQDDVSLCRLQLARVEYDEAAQQMIDAAIKVRALRNADSSGQAFALSTIHPMDLTIASIDRVTWGDKLCGESGRVRDYVLVEMAKAMAPANLELLAASVAPVVPEPAAVLPDPFSFLPGSMEFHNALQEVERARVGADRYEANQRAEQHSPLRLGAPA